MRSSRFVALARLLAVALVAGHILGCATSNHYDGLTALPVERVEPVPTTGDRQAPRLGIAFGGGGVRGFMHLGALKALDEAGIRADVVTGSSAGAVAAALYASGLSYQQIEPLAISVSEFELLDLVFSRQGVVNGKALAAWVREVTGGRQIGELPVPLGIAVTDLVAGRALLIVDGDLGEAVQASASVPGTVVPVHSRGTIYVDGGVLTVLPVRFARAMGANIVIGVDIYCGKHPDPRGNAVDTLLKSFRLQTCALGDAEAAEADFLIRPEFEPTSPTNFSQRDEAVLAGYQAMKAALPALLIRMAQPEGMGKPDQ